MIERKYKEKTNSFLDMLLVVCQRWRALLICLVIGAIVLGAYGWWKSPESIYSEQGIVNMSQITSEQQATIEEYAGIIVKNTDDITIQKEYIDNSLLMKIDPYNVNYCCLCFLIGGNSDIDSLESNVFIVQQCISIIISNQFINSMNDELSGSEDRSGFLDYSELISINTDEQDKGILKINIIASEKEQADIIATYLKEKMSDISQYSSELVGETNYTTISFDVLDHQSAAKTRIINAQNEIETLKKKITKPNEVLYLNQLIDKYSGIDEAQSQEEIQITRRIDAKSVLIGAVLGLLFAIICIMLKYVFSNTIKTTQDFEKCFEVNMMGRFEGNTRFNKKRHSGLDKWIKGIRNKKKNRVSENKMIDVITTKIQVESEKNDLHSLCLLVDDNVTSAMEPIESIINKLQNKISIKVVNNILSSPEKIEEFSKFEGAILVEQIDQSQYYDIKSYCNMCDSFNVKIIGGILFE